MPEITSILKQGVLCSSDNLVDMVCLSKRVYFESLICIVPCRNKIKHSSTLYKCSIEDVYSVKNIFYK